MKNKHSKSQIETTISKKEIDRESYERYSKAIVEIEAQLADIRSQIAAVRRNDGSNLQESSSFLFLVSQELGKVQELNRIKTELSEYVVVDVEKSDDLVSIGDKVTLTIYYPDDDETIEKTYTLVGASPDPLNNEISKSSAIGQFVYGQPIGTSGDVVLPSGDNCHVTIIAKD